MKLRIAKTEHKFFVVDEHLNRSIFQRLDVIINQLCELKSNHKELCFIKSETNAFEVLHTFETIEDLRMIFPEEYL